MLNPHDEIERVLADMETAIEELRSLGDEAARSEVKFKVAFAGELLRAEGPVDVRKARATVACERQELAYRIAAQRVVSQREVLQVLRSRLDGYRTLSANMRTVG